MTQGHQFGRTVSLIVANDQSTRELSQLHIRFSVRAADVETPDTADIRVYNATQATVSEVVNEFEKVILQVGYGGQVATLFQGTIKQTRRGKESNVDSYLDIRAADSDELYNYGMVNTTIAAGSTLEERFDRICRELKVPQPSTNADILRSNGGVLPRGKVMFGLARTYFRQIADSAGARWSFQNGAPTLIPLTGYLPGEPVDINSSTGMIGIPEATEQGVEVVTLINPLIKIGQTVRIDSADISQTAIREQGYPNYTSLSYVATVTPGKGLYRVMVAEHDGDTRANAPWYSRLTCLAVDPSQPEDKSVAAYGGAA